MLVSITYGEVAGEATGGEVAGDGVIEIQEKQRTTATKKSETSNHFVAL